MKKIACGTFGSIYYGRILKNGNMSTKEREDVTSDCVSAVYSHLINKVEFQDTGFFGYTSKDHNNVICVYDADKYKIVPSDPGEWQRYRCSKCQNINLMRGKFCSNCGAQMKYED